jgi:pilus assembly protein CpaB
MKTARIAVLCIALAAGGIAAVLAGRSDPPPPPVLAVAPQIETVDVLVAGVDIGMGHTLAPQEVRWQTWPAAAAGPNFIRKDSRPQAVADLSGAIVRQAFSAGEPIREGKLIKGKSSGYMAAILPAGMRAISTEITAETGAGGFILPNDHVDVILSRRDKEAEKAAGVEVHTSETILGNVTVLAIDQAVEEKNGQKVVVGRTATLGLTPQQAETLARARQMGTLSLALRSLVDSEGSAEAPSDDRNGAANRRGINVVRFGVTTITTSK